MTQHGKLSFVLPVSLREKAALRSPAWWRHSANEGALVRTRLALASFVKNFEQDDLLEFCLVCPSEDQPALTTLLASVTQDPRYRIVDELEICPDIPKVINADTGAVVGWFAQQLIKLAFSRSVASAHYVTLDSDILCLRPCSASNLIPNGLALTNVETVSDYEQLYTPEFCIRERGIKGNRYLGAADILGYQRPLEAGVRFYGETPVVLHTQSVIALTEHLTQRLQQPWAQGLASLRTWTEYSLYFQFLEMTGDLASVCALTGCNGVLDLERSVWQPSEYYRSPRNYDVEHFLGGDQKAARGFFVAIQSWPQVLTWLPSRCQSLREFYDEVEAWLLY